MTDNYSKLDKAKELYLEYIWRLAFLRPINHAPKPEPTDEQLMIWYANLKRRKSR
jgi:hypothetical protein